MTEAEKRPIPGLAPRLLLALLACAMSFPLACVNPVQVAFDERADFSVYRTWTWIPDGLQTRETPEREVSDLYARLGRVVGTELETKGLVQAPRGADLLVGARLQVDRKTITFTEMGATQTLSSHHASASFLVQKQETRDEVFEDARLLIYVADARGRRIIWQAVLQERVPAEFADHLESFVSRVLEHFPPPPSDATPSIRRLPDDPRPRDSRQNSEHAFSPGPRHAIVGRA